MTGFALADVVALLAGAALKGTVVLLAALGATRLMRRGSAASRHLVWTIALAAVVALPVLTLALPAWNVVPVPTLARDAATPGVVTFSPDRAPAPAAPSSLDAASSSVTPSNAIAPLNDVAPSTGVAPVTSIDAPRGIAFDWRVALLALWAIGGALLALRLAYGVTRVWWMRRRAVEITDERWVRIVDGLARRLRVGRIVTLLRETRASVPMTWGVFHPVVLLPEEADDWSDERRTVVLAHELAHVRRYDAATQWIAHLALALFWFNPLVWMAARRLREEREHACDDAVLEMGTRPVEYADHLLDIVRSLGAAEGPVAALAMARRSQFEGRLLAILDAGTPRGRVSRGLGMAALVLAAACLLPLASLGAAPPRAADPVADAASPSVDQEPDLAAAPVPAGTDGEERAAETVASTESAARTVPQVDGGAGEGERKSLLERLGEQVDSLGGRVASLRDGLTGQAPAPAPAIAAPKDTVSLVTITGALRSDAQKATLLRGAMGGDQAGNGTYLQVVRAAAGIASCTEQASVLSTVARQDGLSQEVLAELLSVAEGMETDSDLRYVLATVVREHRLTSLEAQRAFMRAAATLASDGERRYVFAALLERQELPEWMMVEMFRQVKTMTSDHERRYVLVAAADRHRLSARAQDAYVDAVRAMDSDDERRYALDRLVRGTGGTRAAAEPRPERPASSRTRASSSRETDREDGTREWDSEVSLTTGANDSRRIQIVAKDVLIGRVPAEIRGIRPGGSLRVIEEIRGGPTRTMTVLPGEGGTLRRTYRVDGREQPADAGMRWMDSILREFTGT